MNICKTHHDSSILLFVAAINTMKLIKSYNPSLILCVIIGSFNNLQLAGKFTIYRFKDTAIRSYSEPEGTLSS